MTEIMDVAVLAFGLAGACALVSVLPGPVSIRAVATVAVFSLSSVGVGFAAADLVPAARIFSAILCMGVYFLGTAGLFMRRVREIADE